jgi:hypothetical protein
MSLKPYHVWILMTKENSIAIQQSSMATSSSFALKADENIEIKQSNNKANTEIQWVSFMSDNFEA